MSWGVATQNGVSVSLASIVSLSAGVTEFSPADLFTGGTVGAWYDPSDYSTLFQDSAGTTPVTAVEQPVRLMLDKSQGLVLGSELVTGAITWAFSGDTSWTQVSANTVSSTGSTNTNISVNSLLAAIGTQYVQVVMTINFGGGSSGLGVRFDSINPNYGPVTSSGTYRFVGPVDTVSLNIFVYSGFIGTITVSVKVLPGNHALAPNDASRPVLRARYNLLTYSEQFNNAAWTAGLTGIDAFGSGSIADATTAPDGTTTADLLEITAGSSGHFVSRLYGAYTANSTFTFTNAFKAGTHNFVSIHCTSDNSGGWFAATLNLATGAITKTGNGASAVLSSSSVVALGNGWYRLTITGYATAGTQFYYEIDASSSATPTYGNFGRETWTAAGTETIYIWGADLRTGSSAGTYQRIAAATDYATAGFLPYLYFVTDDSFSTGSIDFTATDAMFACAGISKLSDSATGILWELSADSNSNAGSCYITAPQSSLQYFGSFSRGSVAPATAAVVTSSSYAAPITVVQSMVAKVSTDTNLLRLNGAQVASQTADQGTGNYGNYSTFIGRRNNTSFPFNGNFYQLVVCGKTLSAAELASTEAFVATKTGVTL